MTSWVFKRGLSKVRISPTEVETVYHSLVSVLNTSLVSTTPPTAINEIILSSVSVLSLEVVVIIIESPILQLVN